MEEVAREFQGPARLLPARWPNADWKELLLLSTPAHLNSENLKERC
jgi:hypothetical protein